MPIQCKYVEEHLLWEGCHIVTIYLHCPFITFDNCTPDEDDVFILYKKLPI